MTLTLNLRQIGRIPIREADEWLWDIATGFCAAADQIFASFSAIKQWSGQEPVISMTDLQALHGIL